MASVRVPLLERGANGDWSIFESRLFNLLGQELPRSFLFSRRLHITQVMLDAMDEAVNEALEELKP